LYRLLSVKQVADINNYRLLYQLPYQNSLSLQLQNKFSQVLIVKNTSLDLRLIILLGYVFKCLSKQLTTMLIEEAMYLHAS